MLTRNSNEHVIALVRLLLWCTCRGPYGMQDPNFLANGLLGGSLNSLGANALADLALTQVCSPST